MEIDKTTLNDLSIFNGEDDFSVLSRLNYTLTSNGKEQLRKTLATPLKKIEDIRDIQQTLQLILRKESEWPLVISNGTIMVVERFYEYNFDPLPNTVTSLTALNYKM
ncbi:MAG: DNA mismatch repair protein MutS, partial [Ferruginibacter sp.]